jgi:hypothetical protein
MSPGCSLEDRGGTTAIESVAPTDNTDLIEMALYSVESGRHQEALRVVSRISFPDEPVFAEERAFLEKAREELSAGAYDQARKTLSALAQSMAGQ